MYEMGAVAQTMNLSPVSLVLLTGIIIIIITVSLIEKE
jgi:hypothetical protein